MTEHPKDQPPKPPEAPHFGDDDTASAAAESKKAPEIEIEEVDEELLDKALEDFRDHVRGNGLKPESITRKGFEGGVLNFETYEVFKIDPVISEKHVPGKEHGESAGSYSDAQQKIKAMIQRITLDPDVRKLTINLLKKRPDLGFAAENLIVQLERLNKKFVIHEACGSCQTTGKILCQNCHGHQQVVCVKCHGQREEQCHFCHGAQFIDTPQGRQQCTHCHGRGQIGCEMCRQTGEMPCPKCKSTGKMPCHKCNSSGWNSHIFHVAIRAKASFDYDAESLPEELPPLIDEYRGHLLTQKHAHIRIIEDSRKDKEMDERSEPDEYVVPYFVRLPWGDIDFAIKEKEIQGKLFGFLPLLKNMPPVIEKMIGKGLQSLSDGAKGKGNIAQNIGNAVRYRAIAETMLATLRNPPKKALSMMQARYPYGIEKATQEKMIIMAHKSIGHLTKKPRLHGLGIGAGIAALVNAAYFFGPVRQSMSTSLAGTPDIILDIVLALLCGVIITASIQLSVGKAVKQALGRLSETDNKAKIMPPMSKSALVGMPLAFGMLVAFLIITFLTGNGTPDWLLKLTG